MGLAEDLAKQGWRLSEAGLALCSDGLENPQPKDIIRKALDMDYKDIGAHCLPDDINRGKVESLPGNLVLMITKIRNISAPKVKEESSGLPRMMKISMTDGTQTCHAVEFSKIDKISMSTPPGSKVRLVGDSLHVVGGFIKLNNKNIELLGGKVDHLIERWRQAEELAHLKRIGVAVAGGAGPPPWIPFGKKLAANKELANVKAGTVMQKENKENQEEDNTEFSSLRKDAIQEAAKGEQKRFGGGTKQINDSRSKRSREKEVGTDTPPADKAGDKPGEREDRRERRSAAAVSAAPEADREDNKGRRGKGRRDRDEDESTASTAPSKVVSLFDFLEEKIPEPKDKPAAKREKDREGTPKLQDSRRDDRNSRGDRKPGGDDYRRGGGDRRGGDDRGGGSRGGRGGGRGSERGGRGGAGGRGSDRRQGVGGERETRFANSDFPGPPGQTRSNQTKGGTPPPAIGGGESRQNGKDKKAGVNNNKGGREKNGGGGRNGGTIEERRSPIFVHGKSSRQGSDARPDKFEKEIFQSESIHSKPSRNNKDSRSNGERGGDSQRPETGGGRGGKNRDNRSSNAAAGGGADRSGEQRSQDSKRGKQSASGQRANQDTSTSRSQNSNTNGRSGGGGKGKDNSNRSEGHNANNRGENLSSGRNENYNSIKSDSHNSNHEHSNAGRNNNGDVNYGSNRNENYGYNRNNSYSSNRNDNFSSNRPQRESRTTNNASESSQSYGPRSAGGGGGGGSSRPDDLAARFQEMDLQTASNDMNGFPAAGFMGGGGGFGGLGHNSAGGNFSTSHPNFSRPPPNFKPGGSDGGQGGGGPQYQAAAMGREGGGGGGFGGPPGNPNWKKGDQALAKYWEDGEFYPVLITALGPGTAVVLFTDYGNHEEVLVSDLRPMKGKREAGRGGIPPTPGLPPAFRQ